MAYTLDFFEVHGKTGSVAVNPFFFGRSSLMSRLACGAGFVVNV
jgi:hypothetical protein